MLFRTLKPSQIKQDKSIRIRPDDEAGELAASIADLGLLQPVIVRGTAGGYVCVAGQRRLGALLARGEESIPCVVVAADAEKAGLIRLAENIHRRQLSSVEIVAALESIRARNPRMTLADLGKIIGKPATWVTLRYRYVNSRDRLVADGAKEADLDELPEAHVIRLAMAPKERVKGIVKAAVKEKWSARKSYEEAKKAKMEEATRFASQCMADYKGRFGIYVFDETTVVLKIRTHGQLQRLVAELKGLDGVVAAVRPARPARGKWRAKKEW